jgi:hypothetical protein
LVEYIFAGNWNHLERLGIAWYSDRPDLTLGFNYFDENTPNRGLEHVREAINSIKPRPDSKSLLQAAFDLLLLRYQPDKDFIDVRLLAYPNFY